MLPTPVTHIPRGHEASPMRSPRDSDSVGRAWVKHNKGAAQVGADLRAIGKLQRDIEKLRRRIISHGNTGDTQIFHPFKLYNVPPDKATNGADAWRTFRVRTGFITAKSRWTTAPAITGGYGVVLAGDWTAENGSIFCPSGVDNVPGYGTSAGGPADKDDFDFQNPMILPATGAPFATTVLKMTDDATIYSVSDGSVAEFVLGTQDGAGFPSGRFGAAFWIEVSDVAAASFGAKVCGRMVNVATAQYFPFSSTGKIIIPIGIVAVFGASLVSYPANIVGQTLCVEQWLYDHQIPSLPYVNSGRGMALIWRGYSDELTGDNIVWPGDVVTVSGGTFGGHANDAMYQWVGSPGATYSAPPGGFWVRIMRGRTD